MAYYHSDPGHPVLLESPYVPDIGRAHVAAYDRHQFSAASRELIATLAGKPLAEHAALLRAWGVLR